MQQKNRIKALRSKVFEPAIHQIAEQFSKIDFHKEDFGKQSIEAVSANSELLKSWSDSIDVEIKNILKQKFLKNRLSDLAVIALGGYGRRELYPYSDVDLLVVWEGHIDEDALGNALQPLWDLGLKLGMVTRSISECRQMMGLELSSDVAFVDRRFLMGDRSIFEKLEKGVLEPYFKHECKRIAARLTADLKKNIFGDRSSLYRVEPHLKNGVGALRDIHRINWIMKLLGIDFEGQNINEILFRRAIGYIQYLRTFLHLKCGRRMDILEIAMQESLSKEQIDLDNRHGQLLENYFCCADEVRRASMMIFELVEEPSRWIKGVKKWMGGMNLELGLDLSGGVVCIGKTTPTSPDPKWVLEVFSKLALYEVGVSMKLRNFLRHRCDQFSDADFKGVHLGASFKELMDHKGRLGHVLFLMHETGFLDKLCPEFVNIRSKVQYSSYHEFTVDHHTLLCLEQVDRIFLEKSEDGDICRGLPRLWMLRFGLLLHDIGKGLEGVHEVTGQVMAKNISKRFGFDAEETSTLAFLVYRHMMMSQLAFRREPDSTLVSKACLEMKTIERCQLLYLLTRIDVENVGNNTWTEWKGILLEDVYKRCINEISSVEKGIDVGDEGMNTSGLINLFEDIPREMQDIWNEMMTQFTKTDAPQFRWLSYGEVQELTVVNVDRVGLCADMVSSLTCAGFDLLHAILNEQNDGIAVSVYYVIPNSHHRIALKERKAKVKTTWELISGGKVDSKSLMDDYISSYPSHPSREDHMDHENQVLWRHDLSREYTVCEISTRSRTGLLYQVAHTFAIHDIEVLGAKISTIVENAEDVFYLQKSGNSFEMDENSALHLDLLKVISSP